jgi:Ni,Fe-hydrogenase III large subunit
MGERDHPAARLAVARRSGVLGGIVEGWRGTITHRVELAADGTLTRVKDVDPSFSTGPPCPSRWPTRSCPTSR